jgi:hypothetical protein
MRTPRISHFYPAILAKSPQSLYSCGSEGGQDCKKQESKKIILPTRRASVYAASQVFGQDGRIIFGKPGRRENFHVLTPWSSENASKMAAMETTIGLHMQRTFANSSGRR